MMNLLKKAGEEPIMNLDTVTVRVPAETTLPFPSAWMRYIPNSRMKKKKWSKNSRS
jgi:hypothetical protein